MGNVRVEEASLESGDILAVGSAEFEVAIDGDDVLVPPESSVRDADTNIGKASSGPDLVEVADTHGAANDSAADFDKMIDFVIRLLMGKRSKFRVQ